MKREMNLFSGVCLVLGCIIGLLGAVPAQASNSYDAYMVMGGEYLFPGDTLQGADIVQMPDGAENQTGGMEWTNSSDKVYRIQSASSDGDDFGAEEWSGDEWTGEEGEEGGEWEESYDEGGSSGGMRVVLEDAGYVASVRGGTSNTRSFENESAHYMPDDMMEMENQDRPDVAGYQPGTEVEISVGMIPEGQVFDYWEVVTPGGELSLADPNAEITTFYMPDKRVEISAHYKMPEQEIPEEEGYAEENFGEGNPLDGMPEDYVEDGGFIDYEEEAGNEEYPADGGYDDGNMPQFGTGTVVDDDYWNQEQQEENVWIPEEQPGNEENVWTPEEQPGNEENVWTPEEEQPGNEENVWTPEEQPGNEENVWTPEEEQPGNEENVWTPEEEQPGNEENEWSPEEQPGNEENVWTPEEQPGNEENVWTPEEQPGNEENAWTPEEQPSNGDNSSQTINGYTFEEGDSTVIPEDEVSEDPNIENGENRSADNDGDNGGEDNGGDSLWEELPVTYTLTIENGSGNYTEQHSADETVPISAEYIEGYRFLKWKCNAGGVEIELGEAETRNDISFIMPSCDVTFTAIYEQLFQLSVVNGVIAETGSSTGEYAPGTTVEIYADETGDQFTYWSADVPDMIIDWPESQDTTLTMPESDVVITANYDDEEGGIEEGGNPGEGGEEGIPVEEDRFTLTVSGGMILDGGYDNPEAAGLETAEFEPGAAVTIVAYEEEGMSFEKWEADNDTAEISDPAAEETTVIMPNGNVVLTARLAEDEEIPPEDEDNPNGGDNPPVEEQLFTLTVSRGVIVDGGEDNPEAVGRESAEFEPGSAVTIAADEVEGMSFEKWEADKETVEIEDPAAEETTVITTSQDVVLTAEYVSDADNPIEPVTFKLTVQNGTIADTGEAEGTFEAGTQVEVNAAVPEGSKFDSWTSTPDLSTLNMAADQPNATLTMPEQDVTVTANVTLDGGGEEEPEYRITVVNGSADHETAKEGDIVKVTADSSGTFAGWTTTPENLLADPKNAEISFTMPASDVTLTASFEKRYILAVNSGLAVAGSTSGETLELSAGTPVQVTADAPEEGYEFVEWLPEGNVQISDPEAEVITFSMPAENIVLTATYEEIPPEEYFVTVMNGSFLVDGEETDTAVAGATVTLFADEPDEGMIFKGWQSSDVTVADATKEETSFTMPEKNVTVTAQYGPIPTYTITTATNDIGVAGARSGAGTTFQAREGDYITVTATKYANSNFVGWKITADQNPLPYVDDENNYLKANFVMPAKNVRVQAIYEKIPENQVRVINGKGSGTYKKGETVTITANTPAAGYKFKAWEVLTGNVTLANAAAEKTTFTMPSSAVQVRAVYQVVQYKLTVVNGSGGGVYNAGTTVKLTANYPAEGKEFDSWTVTTKNATVSAPTRFYSSLTMPAADVTVQANYKNGPSPSYNEIQGIKNGGIYKTGTNLTFTAVGNGMGNTNPNPGDFRWKPTSYQIGSVKGGWKNGQYTTTMAISTPGDYTLTVLFTKEIYDGRSWTSTGTVDRKSITFTVTDDPKAAQTSDNTPLLPMILAAAGSLLVIILLVIFLIIRRRRR